MNLGENTVWIVLSLCFISLGVEMAVAAASRQSVSLLALAADCRELMSKECCHVSE